MTPYTVYVTFLFLVYTARRMADCLGPIKNYTPTPTPLHPYILRSPTPLHPTTLPLLYMQWYTTPTILTTLPLNTSSTKAPNHQNLKHQGYPPPFHQGPCPESRDNQPALQMFWVEIMS